MLIGRDPEQRLIESLLEDARSGASAALVIRGEAGIGKTALLDHAAQMPGLRALRCAGVESEHDLTFAGLEQLVRPLHDLLDRLPDPQAAALRSALGVGGERVEDRLLLGLATLNLLAEATGDGPLLCTCRRPSVGRWPVGAGHAVRRPPARRRRGGDAVRGARRSRQLVRGAGAATADARPAVRGGRPRGGGKRRGASLSQPRSAGCSAGAWQSAGPARAARRGLAVGRGHGDRGAFRARVAWGFRARPIRLLLLAAASDSGGDADVERARAARRPPAGDSAGGRGSGPDRRLDAVVFRHPLARSAVYSASSPAERAEAHRRLAVGRDATRSRVPCTSPPRPAGPMMRSPRSSSGQPCPPPGEVHSPRPQPRLRARDRAVDGCRRSCAPADRRCAGEPGCGRLQRRRPAWPSRRSRAPSAPPSRRRSPA